jgi:hypothetical protein
MNQRLFVPTCLNGPDTTDEGLFLLDGSFGQRTTAGLLAIGRRWACGDESSSAQ